MAVADDVVRTLAQGDATSGMTLSEIARQVGATRSALVPTLNRLVAAGQVRRTTSRPARFFLVVPARLSEATSETAPPSAAHVRSAPAALDAFAKDNPSLYRCVELAKAAVVYPPSGMSMLIHGPTGTGKSMFARMVHAYAVSVGALDEGAPFVAFNCADYADNPQLLASELMGTRKGAYTGADEDRPGLLEKADGGMLFLDEAHRLPPQGQEMLFNYMDRGVFSRLGDSVAERTARVRLVFATTEDPATSLLGTFMRRVPMVLEMPALAQRSTEERFALIARFFSDESVRVGRSIEVSVNCVRSLLGYTCRGNVGQLQNDVRLLCARAYARAIERGRDLLRITSGDLSPEIADGINAPSSRRQVWRSHLRGSGRFCVFDAEAPSVSAPSTASRDGRSIYDIIDARLDELVRKGCDADDVARAVGADIEAYFSRIDARPPAGASGIDMTSLLPPACVRVTDEILELAERRLGLRCSDSLRYGLAAHVTSAVERLSDGLPVTNPRLEQVKEDHPKEFETALDASRLLEARFGITVPPDEVGFIALFLCAHPAASSVHPTIVVVAHGSQTASSMVDVASELLGFSLPLAFDVALSESPAHVYSRIRYELRGRDLTGGVLLLVDMGSLTNFGDALERDLGCSVRVMPLVSTLHVVESALKASMSPSVDEVYERALRVSDLLGECHQTGSLALPLARPATCFVVTVCSTGRGGADLLRRLLEEKLDLHNGFCEVVPLAYGPGGELERSLRRLDEIGTIVCTISTFPVEFPAEHLSFHEVLGQGRIDVVQQLIDDELLLSQVGDTLGEMLTHVDPGPLLSLLRAAIERVERRCGLRLLASTRVGLVCHLGCLFDRLVAGEPTVPFDIDDLDSVDPTVYDALSDELGLVARELGVSLADDDVRCALVFFGADNVKRGG